jgi:hypothetical protein
LLASCDSSAIIPNPPTQASATICGAPILEAIDG